MIKLKRYMQGIRMAILAALLLLSSAYAIVSDGPNLKGHWVDEKTRCVAEAAGLAYATPKRNGVYTTECSGKSVLAFRGTDMEGHDVWADIEAAFGGNYQMALDQVNWNGVNRSQSWDICTGHSLGGAIAKRFAYNYPARCDKIITFGAPAIRTKPENSKVTEYINYLRGAKMWGQNKYRMIKDIVPTMLISGHQNLKRLINWPTWDAPHARIHAHNMLHYYNKMLGDCPNINMVEKMPFLKLDELNLHKDWQACWINNRQGKSIPVKRFVCTADSNDGNLNCAKQNVIAHDYANGNTFTKEKAIFPINQCTSSGSGSRKTTTCHAGHWRLSGIEGEAGNNGHLKFQIELPAGAKNVEIYLTPLNGNSGDADLYVKKGLEQASTSNYDCLSLNYDAAETCSMGDDPKGGIYNILVSRWTNYDNYRLTVVYKQYF